MKHLLHQVSLIRQTNRLYNDHFDSLLMYRDTTGADVDLMSVETERQNLISDILAGDLDNEPVT